jgi:hypothetical protein
LVRRIEAHKAEIVLLLRSGGVSGEQSGRSIKDVLAEAGIKVIDYHEWHRQQYGGKPDALRDDLRANWHREYRQALDGGMPEPQAWDLAWGAVKSNLVWD